MSSGGCGSGLTADEEGAGGEEVQLAGAMERGGAAGRWRRWGRVEGGGWLGGVIVAGWWQGEHA